jgi:hypothetical protein
MKAKNPFSHSCLGWMTVIVLALLVSPTSEIAAVEMAGTVENEEQIIARYEKALPGIEAEITRLKACLRDIESEIADQERVIREYRTVDEAMKEAYAAISAARGSEESRTKVDRYLRKHPINISDGRVIDSFKDYWVYIEATQNDYDSALEARKDPESNRDLIASLLKSQESLRDRLVQAVSAFRVRSTLEGYWRFTGNPSIIRVMYDSKTKRFVGYFVRVERIEHFKVGNILFSVNVADPQHPYRLKGTEYDYDSEGERETSTVWISAEGGSGTLRYSTADQSLVLERADLHGLSGAGSYNAEGPETEVMPEGLPIEGASQDRPKTENAPKPPTDEPKSTDDIDYDQLHDENDTQHSPARDQDQQPDN